MSETRACDLCGLEVGVRPLLLETPDKRLEFCCEGCLGIYRMLHEAEIGAESGTATPESDASINTNGS